MGRPTQDVTFVSWSQTGDYLALGTGKGSMCIYHRRTNEKARRRRTRAGQGGWAERDFFSRALGTGSVIVGEKPSRGPRGAVREAPA